MERKHLEQWLELNMPVLSNSIDMTDLIELLKSVLLLCSHGRKIQ